MEELNLLKKIERVKAPPDFEQKVLSQLSVRKEKKIKLRNLRLSLAGAGSAAAVIILVITTFILPEGGKMKVSEMNKAPVESGSVYKKAEIKERSSYIPIVEPLDYQREIHTQKKHTIYILEQVSESTQRKIRY